MDSGTGGGSWVLFLGWRFLRSELSCPRLPPPFHGPVCLPVHFSVRPLTFRSAYAPQMPHQMMSPLISLACPPPSCTPLSAICLIASAHFVVAEPLQLDLQKVGLVEVSLHTVHRMALARLPPHWLLTGRRS